MGFLGNHDLENSILIFSSLIYIPVVQNGFLSIYEMRGPLIILKSYTSALVYLMQYVGCLFMADRILFLVDFMPDDR